MEILHLFYSQLIKWITQITLLACLCLFIYFRNEFARIFILRICIIFHNALKQSELWCLFIMLPFHIHAIPIFIKTIKIIDNVDSFKIIEFHFEDFAWKLFSIILLFVFFQFRPKMNVFKIENEWLKRAHAPFSIKTNGC